MNLTGILIPIVTPFDAHLEVDYECLAQLVETFIAKGASSLVVCGTTGEYYTLSDAERERVLTTVAEVAGQRIGLIAGVNDLSTRGSVQRAQQAERLGYQGLMLAPPAYSLPTQAGILHHFQTVADSTQLPLVMYNFPARAGVEIEFDTVVQLSKHPKIQGLKESSGDFSRALRFIQADLPNFELVCGCDDQPVDYFFWGVKGWISGSANVFPAEQKALLDSCLKQQWQQAKQQMSAMYPTLLSMESGNYNQKAKLGCLRHGLQVGPVRAPLADLSAEEQTDFKALLTAFDAH